MNMPPRWPGVVSVAEEDAGWHAGEGVKHACSSHVPTHVAQSLAQAAGRVTEGHQWTRISVGARWKMVMALEPRRALDCIRR